MPFWSGETLESRLPNLIEGFDPEQIDCAAYTLRIGREVYISPSTASEATTRTKRILKENEGFVIPPGQFAFLLTEERVKVPESAIAFISMKARIKFKGLVNVSGFHVDPGYHGRLVFAAYNAGPAYVNLAQGEDCFLIWYASLEGKSGKFVRTGPPFDEIPSDLISPIAGQLHSLAGLSDRIQRVETEQQVIRVGTGIAATLFLGLVILLINLSVQSCRSAINVPAASAPTGSSAPPIPGVPAQAPTSVEPTAVSPAPVQTAPAQTLPSATPAPPITGRPAPPGGPGQTPNPSTPQNPQPRTP